MLSPAHRLTRRSEFSAVVRTGRRAGRSRVVVHVLLAPAAPQAAVADTVSPSRVGLIVSKSVGGSVVRHGVSRKLRHVMRAILPQLPAGSLVVLRALAPAASATSAELTQDIRSALHRLGVLRLSAPA